MVGLGEFNYDNYGGANSGLVWVFFIMATFITSITFMNLLIAIMGDTFDKVSEVKVQSAYKEKMQMIKDHLWIID